MKTILVFFLSILSFNSFCQGYENEIKKRNQMQIEKIKCSEIGLDGIRELISSHKIPSTQLEEKWVASQSYDSLFLHHIIYPYGVARKYCFIWLSQEEMIDKSIEGLKKGLGKYLESERDFKVGSYVVWWSQRQCIGYIMDEIWKITMPLQKHNLPESELKELSYKVKNGDQKSIDILKTHYNYLFEILNQKYIEYNIEISKLEYEGIIDRAISRNLSMEKEYEFIKNELEFEDIIFLEYCLLLENKIK